LLSPQYYVLPTAGMRCFASARSAVPAASQSLPPGVQWCLDHGETGGENSKAFFEPTSFPSDLVRPRTASPPSVVRLVKPVFEELVGCVLSFRGRAIQRASAEAGWTALLLSSHLVLCPMADFISAGNLPPYPVTDYRDKRLAHLVSRDLDTLLSAARAHASLNGRAPPPTSLSRAGTDPISPSQPFHNGVSPKVTNLAARLAAVGEYRRAMEALL
jgi:hypothetical protein